MSAHPLRLLGIAFAAALTLTAIFGLFTKAHGRGFDWFFAHIKPTGRCNGGSEIAASFYWQGKRTATGAAFDANGNTAASRTLPFGTRVRLRNPLNNRIVTVTINDRGPYGIAHDLGVKLDLARGAAQRLGMRATQWLCVEE